MTTNFVHVRLGGDQFIDQSIDVGAGLLRRSVLGGDFNNRSVRERSDLDDLCLGKRVVNLCEGAGLEIR